jgi:hypothetical protein
VRRITKKYSELVPGDIEVIEREECCEPYMVIAVEGRTGPNPMSGYVVWYLDSLGNVYPDSFFSEDDQIVVLSPKKHTA